MKKSNWNFNFALILIVISALIYYIHYLVFHEAHHMFLFLVEDIAFIPIEVLIVSLLVHKILEEREKKHILEKLNMLIGVFYSEIGNKLLDILVEADNNLDPLDKFFINIENWNDKDFNKKSKEVLNNSYEIDMKKINMLKLGIFLSERREFLLGIMQNPSILEHETFTELLRTVFHLEDELKYRKNLETLSEDDLDHLKIDTERIYPWLIYEWTIYMKYMKKSHPYLFSLGVRKNPFNKKVRENV